MLWHSPPTHSDQVVSLSQRIVEEVSSEDGDGVVGGLVAMVDVEVAGEGSVGGLLEGEEDAVGEEEADARLEKVSVVEEYEELIVVGEE